MTLTRQAVKEARRIQREQEAALQVEEVRLEQGAVLYLREQLDGRWIADVRWPSPKERDPELAAGGYRRGTAATKKEAEKLGRALFREGSRSEARQ